MKRIVISILLAASLVFSASVGLAGEKAKEGNWDFNLAPLYVWMVDMEGDYEWEAREMIVEINDKKK